MTREYGGYQAHELRHGIVQASDDALVVLLGPLRLQPGTQAAFRLEFPAAFDPEPEVDVHFIPLERIPGYIRACEDGKLPYPPDLHTYARPDVITERNELDVQLSGDRPGRMPESWESVQGFAGGSGEARVADVSLEFEADPEEGAYLIRVGHHGPAGVEHEFSVIVYSKPSTTFPADHDDDLSDLLYRGVNLSTKNGVLWFVHPIYFAEQHLGVKLAPDVTREMVTCEGLPGDLPASDEVVVPIQWGWGHYGLRKIRLDVDPESQPEPCVDHSRIETRAEAGLTADYFDEVGS